MIQPKPPNPASALSLLALEMEEPKREADDEAEAKTESASDKGAQNVIKPAFLNQCAREAQALRFRKRIEGCGKRSRICRRRCRSFSERSPAIVEEQVARKPMAILGVAKPSPTPSKRGEMSATGLEVFDKSIQTTNIWLDEIMEEIGGDRRAAWHVLRAVLHTLRDRLTLDQAVHLGAQLPIVIRGIYYDQWHPAGKPEKSRTEDEFVASLNEEMQDTRPIDPREAARAVFTTISNHVSTGQVEKIRHSLPEVIRQLWPADGEMVV